jgi:hypothetical protein
MKLKLNPRRKPVEVKIAAPKTLIFPPFPSLSDPSCKKASPTLSERTIRGMEEPAVREETRQKIGAKELAGQRQLERKRLNKMLAIFDDQKIKR